MKEVIIDFFKKNVLGKRLATDELIYSLEDGKLEGVYSDRMTFSDLLISANGFQFDMALVTKEKVYNKDAEGNRLGIVKDYTGAGIYHYEMAQRKSTSEITGYMRLLSASVGEHTMEAVVYGAFNMRLDEGQLKWQEQQLLYRDMPTDRGTYRPVAFDADIRFYIEEGKLRFEYVPHYYDVDAKTMGKTLSKDHCPTFTAKEK